MLQLAKFQPMPPPVENRPGRGAKTSAAKRRQTMVGTGATIAMTAATAAALTAARSTRSFWRLCSTSWTDWCDWCHDVAYYMSLLRF